MNSNIGEERAKARERYRRQVQVSFLENMIDQLEGLISIVDEIMPASTAPMNQRKYATVRHRRVIARGTG